MNLKIGDIAPDLTGIAENGQKVSLADFRGKKVVLFFYPKDMTLNCTIEAGNLRDHFVLQRKGIPIIGINTEQEHEYDRLKTKYGLPHPLITDTDKRIVKMYGVRGSTQFIGIPFRGIPQPGFLINEQGMVEALIDKVRIAGIYRTGFSIN